MTAQLKEKHNRGVAPPFTEELHGLAYQTVIIFI